MAAGSVGGEILIGIIPVGSARQLGALTPRLATSRVGFVDHRLASGIVSSTTSANYTPIIACRHRRPWAARRQKFLSLPASDRVSAPPTARTRHTRLRHRGRPHRADNET